MIPPLADTLVSSSRPDPDESIATDRSAPVADRILSPKQVSEQLTLSVSTLWRMRQRGELPEPIRLSPGRVGWRQSTINNWLETRRGR